MAKNKGFGTPIKSKPKGRINKVPEWRNGLYFRPDWGCAAYESFGASTLIHLSLENYRLIHDRKGESQLTFTTDEYMGSVVMSRSQGEAIVKSRPSVLNIEVKLAVKEAWVDRSGYRVLPARLVRFK